MLDKLLLARPGIGSDEDESYTFSDIMFLEAAVLVGHRQAAGLLLLRFAGTEMLTTGFYYITCIPRHLGAAAALLGRPDEALGYYQTALEVCREMPFRPEAALTRLQLAELLLEHYASQRDEAMEHLDLATAEFDDMKMQPSLERAVSLKERAEAGPVRAPTYPDGLTQREVEVLRLIAAGRTDRQIAEELFISFRTVGNHVRSILNRTGTANRTEAATYASRNDLL